MLFLARVALSGVFLLAIVLSIPISFDVGGRDSGLAYSLTLFGFYLVDSAVKAGAAATERRGRQLGLGWSLARLVLRLLQWIAIPVLLIWALGRFAVEGGSSAAAAAQPGARAGWWVERTLAGVMTAVRGGGVAQSWHDWAFGKGGVVEAVTLGSWDGLLRHSSPVFQLLEGFCSLLVIQAAGQITRWLVNRGRSDTWVIVLLVFSGSIISSAVYFLWRVANFPQISNLDATLIGITMTSAVFLCAFGIGSGRGNPVESSLLFAYVVLCVYQMFTDYLPAGGPGSRQSATGAAYPHHPHQQYPYNQQHMDQPLPFQQPPLPPIIMASYTTFLHMIGTLPSAVRSSLVLLYAAFQTITPSVIISLTFRTFVFYCATRIIPAVRESGASALMRDPPSTSLEDGDAASRFVAVLGWFSPSILIAVYTSLLLQHFSASDGPDGWTLRGGNVGGGAWRWTNVAATMLLYGIELYLGNGDPEHWKVD